MELAEGLGDAAAAAGARLVRLGVNLDVVAVGLGVWRALAVFSVAMLGLHEAGEVLHFDCLLGVV